MKNKRPLAEVQTQANWLIEELGEGCERIEVAGSVRRRKPEVGDIEIVCIPRRIPRFDMFGEYCDSDSALDELLDELEWKRIKDGSKYKQLLLEDGTQLDLFICTPETWAVNLLLRTGSAEFSHRFVTQKQQGGMMPHGWRVKDARLWRGNEPQLIFEETDLFAAIGAAWVEPVDRTD
jgi:DNA polymerase/3'-5' exonuclease PolX